MAGAVVAQTQMPDPFVGVFTHYQVEATLPVQTELRDCHLFEVLSWGRGINETRTRMRMACQYLTRMGPGGSDPDQAMRGALLAFEADARADAADRRGDAVRIR
jgi:hypothetical protein